MKAGKFIFKEQIFFEQLKKIFCGKSNLEFFAEQLKKEGILFPIEISYIHGWDPVTFICNTDDYSYMEIICNNRNDIQIRLRRLVTEEIKVLEKYVYFIESRSLVKSETILFRNNIEIITDYMKKLNIWNVIISKDYKISVKIPKYSNEHLNKIKCSYIDESFAKVFISKDINDIIFNFSNYFFKIWEVMKEYCSHIENEDTIIHPIELIMLYKDDVLENINFKYDTFKGTNCIPCKRMGFEKFIIVDFTATVENGKVEVNEKHSVAGGKLNKLYEKSKIDIYKDNLEKYLETKF